MAMVMTGRRRREGCCPQVLVVADHTVLPPICLQLPETGPRMVKGRARVESRASAARFPLRLQQLRLHVLESHSHRGSLLWWNLMLPITRLLY